MINRCLSFLCVTLALSGSADNSVAVVSKKDRHTWEYITYGDVQPRGKEFGSGLSLLIGFGEKTEGFRFDILSGGGDNEPAAFKKGGIVVRLHRPDGNVITSTNSTGPVGANGTWSIISFFPWSTNDLEEAWVEASVQGETYWLEVPYGFTRNPNDSLSKSQKIGGPKRAAAMKKLGAHDHVVPWKDVHYDLGLIQKGWRLLLIQSNPFDGVSEVELYRDDSRVGKSM